MTYLDEFQSQIQERNFHKFFTLWEEYCTSDTVDPQEFIQILKAIKESSFTDLFGQFAETGLPLWELIENPEDSYEVLKLIFDLQTTNTTQLADLALEAIEKKYPNDPNLQERLKLIGLRTKENFQYALRNYELLHHMKKGNFVYHTKGWGTGEIMDVSPLRETVTVELENVHGLKHITFTNAFKCLDPMPRDHFLARRFADPDKLEKEAKKNPTEVMKLLLRDLGPKTAEEIKDELCELVIPDADWTKWWQSARTRLKKDTMVECPNSLKEPFILRASEVSHEERLLEALKTETRPDSIIFTSYSFVRDFPNVLRNKEVNETLLNQLKGLLEQDLIPSQEIQILLFLDEAFGQIIPGKELDKMIQGLEHPAETVRYIEILAFKKRALKSIHQYRSDWEEIFFQLLKEVDQNPLRDYLLIKLNQKATRERLSSEIADVQRHPEQYPELLFWYFQKLYKAKPEEIPFANKSGLCDFFETLLILLDKLDTMPEQRDLNKKIYNLLIAKRYEVVRHVIEGTDLEFIREFLLLIAKCHALTNHDKEIMRSLAQVVHPSLAPVRKKQSDENVLWATESSYQRILARIKEISQVEMIENSKEIEAARELGDLRENAEFKFAKERRSRLQAELKKLSDEMGRARIITPDDIEPEQVGIGNIVKLQKPDGEMQKYTILGSWDADADKNILSNQSRIAQEMMGRKVGEAFSFGEENYTIVEINSFLEQ